MDTPLDIAPEELVQRRQDGKPVVLVDCREPWEHAIVHLPGDVLIPLGELGARVDEVPRDGEVIVYCHHGVRSRRGALILRANGVPARSLAGGIDYWAHAIDPALPRY